MKENRYSKFQISTPALSLGKAFSVNGTGSYPKRIPGRSPARAYNHERLLVGLEVDAKVNLVKEEYEDGKNS